MARTVADENDHEPWNIEPSARDERNYAIGCVLADAALRREISWQDCEQVLDALQAFDAEREDLVRVAAAERLKFYKMLGGTKLTLDDFTARCRVALQTGQWV